MKKLIFITLFSLFLFCCNRTHPNVHHASYWWKTTISWDDHDRQVAKEIGLTKLYVRYFDVSRTPAGIVPNAPVRGLDKLPRNLSVVPVVYVTMDALRAVNNRTSPILAEKIIAMVKRMHHGKLSEIQIDCDWTASTQDAYFTFIKQIKSNFSGTVSVTIRLHQIKFVAKCGTPPADRGMLMYYNMGDPGKMGNTNSIIDYPLIDSYTKTLGSYPIPLDCAFPLFSWGVLFREDKMAGLIRDLNSDDLANPILTKIDSNYWKVTGSGSIRGVSVHQGDLLRFDDSSPQTVLKTVHLAATRGVHSPTTSVSFFVWDSTQINRFSSRNIVRMYDSFQ